MWGKIMIPSIGHDYIADMDYMDLTVCCLQKAVKLNHSLKWPCSSKPFPIEDRDQFIK